jgi:DNA repair exonuclease SbcCD ATPase subunit
MRVVRSNQEGIQMAEVEQKLAALKEDPRQARDELRVQMHLAKADARDEWESLESKWGEFQQNLDKVEDAAEDAAEDVGKALSVLGEELKSGYERIRKAL